MKLVRKKRFALLAFVFLFFTGIHLLLKYRSRQVFGTLVEQLSHGDYEVETAEVDISYVPFSIEVRQLHLKPTSTESGLQQLDCDVLLLKIESITQFLLHRNLDVAEFTAVKPALHLRQTEKQGADPNKAKESVKAIQSQLFELFDLLKAEKIRLDDCSFRMDHGNGKDEYFSINHFWLALDDFHLQKQSGSIDNPFQGEASFSLLHPEIHLADTNVTIGVNELRLDKSSQALTIDSLYILVRDEEMQYEGIRLASVGVKNLNWSLFLEEGRIEIDSATVLSGTASLNLSKSEKEGKRKKNKRKTYDGSPVKIHSVSIKDISYSLLTKDYLGKKDNKVLFAIQGEKFEVTDLELDPEKHPAISAKEIDVRLKDYSENDANESYSVSVGAVKFTGGDLTLNDYLLRPKKPNTDNKVSVRQLKVESLSLEEMLMRKVEAQQLVIVQPEVVIDTKKRAGKGRRSETADESIGRLLGGLEDRVAVGSIVIDNGSLRLRSVDSTGQDIVLSGVALRLAGKSTVKSRSINDVLRSIDEFRTGAFTIKGPSTDLRVDRLRWLADKSGLRFDRATGKLGDNTLVDFYGMEIDLKKNVMGDGGAIDASMLRVDSGKVIVQGPMSGKKRKGPSPFFRSEKVRLENIDVAYSVGNKLIASSRISISIDNLGFDREKKLWSKIYLYGIKNLFQGGETTIEADEISASQPGVVSFKGVKGAYASSGKKIKFNTEEFSITGGWQDGGLSAAPVQSVFLKQPVIEATFDRREKAAAALKKNGKGVPATDIAHLEMSDPRFTLTIIDSTGKTITRSQSMDGAIVLDSLRLVKEENAEHLKVKRLGYKTDHISGEFMEELFDPARLDISIRDIDYDLTDRSVNATVERMSLEDFHYDFVGSKKDTTVLKGDRLVLYDWHFNSNEKKAWKELLETCRWSADGITVIKRNAKNSVRVNGLYVHHDGTYDFGFSDMELVNSGSRESFWSDNPFEKDFISMKLKGVECKNATADFSRATPFFTLPCLTINDLFIRPERDKTRPEDTVGYRPLLCRQLFSIPFDVMIDSLHLQDGRVEYHEIGQRTGKEGVLSISKLNGFALNLRNTGIRQEDSLIIRMSGSLYDQGVFRVNFRQSYNDSLQGFWMRIRLSEFDMARMNPLLLPLMRIELRSGKIDTMTILVKGNDHFAFGTIDMRYDNLYVGLGADGSKRTTLNKLADWAANFYIRNSDNGKPNILFRRRIKKRGQFNYWGKIAVEGLLSDIGIKGDDAERRAFEKAVRSYELPVDYWSEE